MAEKTIEAVIEIPKGSRSKYGFGHDRPGKSTLTAGFEGADAAWKVTDDAAPAVEGS
jgi:hypothetical protein